MDKKRIYNFDFTVQDYISEEEAEGLFLSIMEMIKKVHPFAEFGGGVIPLEKEEDYAEAEIN